jgi:hypothetical protein
VVSFELVLAALTAVAVTVWYAWVAQDGLPPPGSFIGHGLGIAGLALMLAAETLYTIRKRAPNFHLWSLQTWLQLHIVCGIVGPYLVLLHTAGKFGGLAGVVALLTGVIVISGFIGRYLYTATPRSFDGTALDAPEVESEIAAANRQLRELAPRLGESARLLAPAPLPRDWVAVLARPWLRLQNRLRLGHALHELRATDAAAAAEVKRLLGRRYRLELQGRSLAAARRLMSLWHAWHVPLGVMLFSLAFIHVFAALYYATLLK